ncbi:AraC family transcriptional regulator [Paenibacillus koleovorans]|uniref:AraC family transcriptional regulator n=1 Tax=Paenibacillus koleovorans TaxID=121608 RepID=UPI000FD83CFD|nr:helix-turn-helix domain-containing protein [Paenibacillus koleovorans]
MTQQYGGVLGSNKKSWILVSFLLPYMIAFTFPLLVSVAIYYKQLRSIESDYQQTNLQMLEQYSGYMDARIREMNSIIKQVSGDPIIDSLLSSTKTFDSGDLTYTVRQSLDKMSLYKGTTQFFTDFGVYNKNNGILITSDTAYTNLREEYGELLQYGDLNYNQFKNLLDGTHRSGFMPAASYTHGINQEDVLIYVDSIPKSSINPKGCIYFLIPIKDIHSIFSKLLINNGSFASILDQNGAVLDTWPKDSKLDAETTLSIHKAMMGKTGMNDMKVGNQRMLVYSVYSQGNGLTYVSVLPYSTVVNRVLYIKNIILGITTLLILLGLIMSVVLSRRNSKPLLSIIRAVERLGIGSSNKSMGLRQLEGSVMALVSNNEELRSRIDQQLPILQYAFFSKLFSNEIFTDSELEAYISRLKLPIHKGHYVALLIYLNGDTGHITELELKQLQAVKLIMNDMINQMDNLVYIHDSDLNKVIAVFNGPADPDDWQPTGAWMQYLENSIGEIAKELRKQTRNKLLAAGGIPVRSLSEIGLSLSAARQALTYLDPKQVIVWYQDIKIRLFFYYPLELETRIINLVYSGVYKGIATVLDELYDANFSEKQLSEHAYKQLIFDMLGTVNKLIHNSKINEEKVKSVMTIIIDIQVSPTVSEAWEKFHEMYRILSAYFLSSQLGRHDELISKAKNFLLLNYSDPQLNIQSVAEFIGISTEYFSQLFKEKTGEYYSDYLETCRINHAVSLLERGDRVEEVAAKVGYNSATAFRRAFKRHTGVNPTSFRKIKTTYEDP